jgi:sugar phosphate isomerase/epimerase
VSGLTLGIVSDEIDNAFPVAAGHAREWGISRFELRCLKTGRVPAVDPAELDEVEKIVREQSLSVTALSPGMFKNHVSDAEAIEQELREVLPATVALGRRLNVPLIIVFGFKRNPGEPASMRDGAIGYFRRAAEVAAAAGMKVAVENEPGFWCDTGVNTRDIIRDVGAPGLGVNWDPCNAYGTTETPYPDGYNAVRDVIFNVHAKDTLKGSLIQCVPIGNGAIDWTGQMAALCRDRPVQHITIETHCHPLVENSLRNVRTLQSLIHQNT